MWQFLSENLDELNMDQVPQDVQLDEVKVEINMKEVQKAFTKTLTKKKRVRLCFATRLKERNVR